MTAQIKFLQWVLRIAFVMGLTSGFINLTYAMAKAAAHSHQHEQVSWGKFSRMLWSDTQNHLQKEKIIFCHP